MSNGSAPSRKWKRTAGRACALDCFGIGWEGYNTTCSEVLSRNAMAVTVSSFTGRGAHRICRPARRRAQVAASDCEGAGRVSTRSASPPIARSVYAKHPTHQGTVPRNTVTPRDRRPGSRQRALHCRRESRGEGPLCTVRVRFKIPRHDRLPRAVWDVPYTATPFCSTNPARHAPRRSASAFPNGSSPVIRRRSHARCFARLPWAGVPEVTVPDPRPKKLRKWMIRQAKSIAGMNREPTMRNRTPK